MAETEQAPDWQEFQAKQDSENLNLLSILWKIYAGIASLGLCFGGFYVLMGGFVGAEVARESKDEAASRIVPALFSVFGLGFMALFGALAVLCFLVGNRMASRTGYTLCFVMACLIVLNAPFGTALGVFTLIVLNRQSVKALFGAA